MFARSYFCDRAFAPRYFPRGVAAPSGGGGSGGWHPPKTKSKERVRLVPPKFPTPLRVERQPRIYENTFHTGVEFQSGFDVEFAKEVVAYESIAFVSFRVGSQSLASVKYQKAVYESKSRATMPMPVFESRVWVRSGAEWDALVESAYPKVGDLALAEEEAKKRFRKDE